MFGTRMFGEPRLVNFVSGVFLQTQTAPVYSYADLKCVVFASKFSMYMFRSVAMFVFFALNAHKFY